MFDFAFWGGAGERLKSRVTGGCPGGQLATNGSIFCPKRKLTAPGRGGKKGGKKDVLVSWLEALPTPPVVPLVAAECDRAAQLNYSGNVPKRSHDLSSWRPEEERRVYISNTFGDLERNNLVGLVGDTGNLVF